jgi:hypothetical protein
MTTIRVKQDSQQIPNNQTQWQRLGKKEVKGQSDGDGRQIISINLNVLRPCLDHWNMQFELEE